MQWDSLFTWHMKRLWQLPTSFCHNKWVRGKVIMLLPHWISSEVQRHVFVIPASQGITVIWNRICLIPLTSGFLAGWLGKLAHAYSVNISFIMNPFSSWITHHWAVNKQAVPSPVQAPCNKWILGKIVSGGCWAEVACFVFFVWV